MNLDLEKLIHLQRLDTDLRRVEAELQSVPGRKAEMDGRLAEERRHADGTRDALAQSQKTRRQQESELQDFEQKRSKYKGQLMEVKTNKEYTAMLHEIESVEREIRIREDQILQEMERAEALAADVKREEAAFRLTEERHRGETRALEQRAAVLEQEARRLRAERGEVASTLPEAVLDQYNRVARLRGLAVAEARDGMCQACRVKLRPQMFVDVKHNDQVVQCPSCSRILYFEPAPPDSAPQP